MFNKIHKIVNFIHEAVSYILPGYNKDIDDGCIWDIRIAFIVPENEYYHIFEVSTREKN